MPTQLTLPSEQQPLPEGGVRSLIRDLAAEHQNGTPDITGCIQLFRGDRTGELWIQGGYAYAAHLADYEPPVLLRLHSAGFISQEEYEELKTIDAYLAGPEAVARKWASAKALDAIHREVLLSVLSHLYEWEDANWKWDEAAKTEKFVTTGIPLPLAIAACDERIGQWKAVTRAYPGVVQPKAIPQAGPDWAAKAGNDAEPEMAALLSQINGINTVAQISTACGFTRFEVTRYLAKALADGIIILGKATNEIQEPFAGARDAQGEPAATANSTQPEIVDIAAITVELERARAYVAQLEAYLKSVSPSN